MNARRLLPTASLVFTLLALPACSGDDGPAPGDSGPDVATTAYCTALENKCKTGDQAACAEAKAKCPFTTQYDTGTSD